MLNPIMLKRQRFIDGRGDHGCRYVSRCKVFIKLYGRSLFKYYRRVRGLF